MAFNEPHDGQLVELAGNGGLRRLVEIGGALEAITVDAERDLLYYYVVCRCPVNGELCTMSEPKTNCSSCGCQIPQRTADRNGGLCAPCHRKATSPPPPEEVFKPVPPVTRAALDDAIIQHQRDAVIDILFDPACDKVNFRPAEMTEGDIIVYTIWTFLGETCNGGIIQYLTNQSGGWAHHCGPSLRQIGADKYADIIEECIQEFTDAETAQDPHWESDLYAYWAEHEETFEAEDRFWEFYFANKDELPDLLYRFICGNRDLFAPFTIGA